MSKLCLIYNFAQRYREAIFKAIDAEWDCEWYFGRNTTDIKGMDISQLKDAHEVDNKHVGHSPYFYQTGTLGLSRRRDISTYFVLGDPHCLSIWLLAAYTKLFARKKRIYYWTHGWYGKESKVTAWIKKRFFKLADGIFLYGNYARDLMINEGFDARRLFTIHNSLHYARQLELRKSLTPSDLYQKYFGNTNPNIIFIGRLTKVKKLDMLLEAVARLKSEGTDFNITFVGDGQETENLKAKARELGISENIWYYGACYDEETNAKMIYNADLCVAPGNVGLTAMHSMVFGTPVISHNDFKWQMPEFEAIHPGETGDFFEANSVESLSTTIRKWFKSHTDRDAVRTACYKDIDENWTPEFQMEVLRKHLKV